MIKTLVDCAGGGRGRHEGYAEETLGCGWMKTVVDCAGGGRGKLEGCAEKTLGCGMETVSDCAGGGSGRLEGCAEKTLGCGIRTVANYAGSLGYAIRTVVEVACSRRCCCRESYWVRDECAMLLLMVVTVENSGTLCRIATTVSAVVGSRLSLGLRRESSWIRDQRKLLDT